jgi:hypothetical protein
MAPTWLRPGIKFINTAIAGDFLSSHFSFVLLLSGIISPYYYIITCVFSACSEGAVSKEGSGANDSVNETAVN